MGHDEQNQVLSTVHAEFIFGAMLSIPADCIKTQLQVQHKSDVYKGMIDCAMKIYRSEGVPGLYRGFWISSVQIVSGVFYISTYEGVRHLLNDLGAGHRVKALIGGGCASLVGQTIIVPFDVISQHAMVLGMSAHAAGSKADMNPLGIKSWPGRSRLHISMDIGREIMRRDGLRGFYRGYTASLMAYVPNSAMWWAFYHLYQGKSRIYIDIPISCYLLTLLLNYSFRRTISYMPLLGLSSIHTMCGRKLGWLYNDNSNKSIGHSASTSSGKLSTYLNKDYIKCFVLSDRFIVWTQWALPSASCGTKRS